jgi:hypothetical protein
VYVLGLRQKNTKKRVSACPYRGAGWHDAPSLCRIKCIVRRILRGARLRRFRRYWGLAQVSETLFFLKRSLNDNVRKSAPSAVGEGYSRSGVRRKNANSPSLRCNIYSRYT